MTDPQTATIDGVDMRIAGATAGDDHVVVAQNLDSVAQAQSTLILAELLIAPLLLLVVFVGAVAIGRRVAARSSAPAGASSSSPPMPRMSCARRCRSSRPTPAWPWPRIAAEAWYRTAFGRVDLESKRMRRLLDDLLWLARFDATSAPPNVEPVDLGVLAAQTADRFGVVAEARHLRLDVRVPSESLVINAPPEWLDRLLGVLLDNACKYSPEGGTVTVSVVPERTRIGLIVDDRGPGIPEDERARIFDRFHRATRPAGRGRAGSGHRRRDRPGDERPLAGRGGAGRRGQDGRDLGARLQRVTVSKETRPSLRRMNRFESETRSDPRVHEINGLGGQIAPLRRRSAWSARSPTSPCTASSASPGGTDRQCPGTPRDHRREHRREPALDLRYPRPRIRSSMTTWPAWPAWAWPS